MYALELGISGVRAWGLFVKLLGRRFFDRGVGQPLLDVSGALGIRRRGVCRHEWHVLG
jgi:hypothetical protein